MGILFQFIKYKAMTREEAKELMPIIKAFADGKTVQYRISATFPRRYIRDFSYLKEWNDINEENFNGFIYDGTVDYRIKPEPYYRPFRSQEECVKEMMNHTPFGIVTDGVSILKVAIYPNGIYLVGLSVPFHIMPFSKSLETIRFSDGKEFGIKVQP